MTAEVMQRGGDGGALGSSRSRARIGSAEGAPPTIHPPVGGLSNSCRPSSRKWVSKLEKVEDARNLKRGMASPPRGGGLGPVTAIIIKKNNIIIDILMIWITLCSKNRKSWPACSPYMTLCSKIWVSGRPFCRGSCNYI